MKLRPSESVAILTSEGFATTSYGAQGEEIGDVRDWQRSLVCNRRAWTTVQGDGVESQSVEVTARDVRDAAFRFPVKVYGLCYSPSAPHLRGALRMASPKSRMFQLNSHAKHLDFFPITFRRLYHDLHNCRLYNNHKFLTV
jgi:hypothetical protein